MAALSPIRRQISTHTPVRVWHKENLVKSIRFPNFNSHTREGVTYNAVTAAADICISTHTPVRV